MEFEFPSHDPSREKVMLVLLGDLIIPLLILILVALLRKLGLSLIPLRDTNSVETQTPSRTTNLDQWYKTRQPKPLIVPPQFSLIWAKIWKLTHLLVLVTKSLPMLLWKARSAPIRPNPNDPLSLDMEDTLFVVGSHVILVITKNDTTVVDIKHHPLCPTSLFLSCYGTFISH